jgi:uncharacterized protein YjbI with pentapeptide repeats
MGGASSQTARAVLFALAGFLAALAGAPGEARAQVAPSADCNLQTKDFSNKTLSWCNFSGRDLTGAKFSGATLTGVVLIRATLTGADFTNAVFANSNNPVLPNDFTMADLTQAVFRTAKFQGPTYFTYATVTCADFSQTDISNGNAVFGNQLDYNPSANCTAPPNRVRFQGTTMNCEFIDNWRDFDLTGANVTACLAQFAGRNFSNAMMGNVNFTNAILDGVNFNSAHLEGAVLNNASLQCQQTPGNCVDLSSAQLLGANLNKANLTGASLHLAYLSNTNGGAAATVTNAHLKNVNLSFAQLSGVDFTAANFYGNHPANSAGCKTTGERYAGFTITCASAFQANMVGTRFPNAYLYGVDFRNAIISGVSFENAVLVGTNFAAATIGTNPTSSAPTTFHGAYLQGTNLDSATTTSLELGDAYVDFAQGGNQIYIYLSGAVHNGFACSTPSTCLPPTGQDVCVWIRYPVTTVPAGNTVKTCPDESPGPCGPADPSGNTTRWKSTWTIGAPPEPPAGWYSNQATYTPAAPNNLICNGKTSSDATIFW